MQNEMKASREIKNKCEKCRKMHLHIWPTHSCFQRPATFLQSFWHQAESTPASMNQNRSLCQKRKKRKQKINTKQEAKTLRTDVALTSYLVKTRHQIFETIKQPYCVSSEMTVSNNSHLHTCYKHHKVQQSIQNSNFFCSLPIQQIWDVFSPRIFELVGENRLLCFINWGGWRREMRLSVWSLIMGSD